MVPEEMKRSSVSDIRLLQINGGNGDRTKFIFQ
jgi:hypothetical protein